MKRVLFGIVIVLACMVVIGCSSTKVVETKQNSVVQPNVAPSPSSGTGQNLPPVIEKTEEEK